MTLDYAAVISDEAARIVDAYERDRSATVPWSDRWKVGTVARHVAGTHHVVAQIISGRPDADFGLFATLEAPDKDAPEFVEWFRSGTASLLEELSNTPADDTCWSWFADGCSVGWWARRMAHEAVIHRYDTDAALGQAFTLPTDVAADGVDEYLDVFVAATRGGNGSPAGPTVSFECSDAPDRWLLDLTQPGERTVSRDAGAASLQIRGTAQQLLLFVWGRVPRADSTLEVSGDAGPLEAWSTLVPPM
jgi:uncharacterized protein (TIGR03083 family)